MSKPWVILDLSSAPIEGAGELVEPVKAPANYKDPAKIAEYVAEKTAERQAMVATDLDLARITGACWWHGSDGEPHCSVAKTAEEEQTLIERLAVVVGGYSGERMIVTYGGHKFDMPLLMRRARYVGVKCPVINVDRYKSPHRDVMAVLSDNDWGRTRPLDFYCRRLGWTDLLPKPLSGADEANVPQTGDWAGLEASLRRDVEAIRRLADWLGLL